MMAVLMVFADVILAQDQQFTQFYAVPNGLNPAFAGASVQSRLSMQYRNQWAAIPGGFQAGNCSYDQYISDIKSGVGLMFSYDRAGSGGLSTSALSVQYAYEAKIRRNWYFRPALQFGYGMKSINFEKLTFYDQMIREGNPTSIEQGTVQPVSYFDMGAGLLTYGKKFWLGVSAYHNNTPNTSFYDNSVHIQPRRLSAHGGYRFRIKGRSLKKIDHYLVAAMNYEAQKKFDHLDLGLYYEFNPMILGLWYRGLPVKSNQYGYMNHDAIALLVGFQSANYKFGYSYDITISRLGIANSAGSHELSLTYQWANRRNARSKRIRIVPCAKF